MLAALQADATLSTKVRMWYSWGEGLLQRYQIEPSDCPLVSLTPAQLDEDELSNAARSWPQDVEIGIATDGQDAEPCEELVAAVLDVVLAQSDACLGLCADGVSGLNLVSIRWQTEKNQKDPSIRWVCILVVRINWMRRLT